MYGNDGFGAMPQGGDNAKGAEATGLTKNKRFNCWQKHEN